MDYVFIVMGLIGLFLGGEALVRGSVNVARRLSISPLIIGLTVVGFGTSTPELLVSVQAALQGAPDIAVGNVIGSCVANLLLILGVTSLVTPIRIVGATLRRDTAVMVAAGLVLVPLFAIGEIGRWAGGVLVAGLAFYLIWAVLTPGDHRPEEDGQSDPQMPVLTALLWIGFGFAALLFGAQFLVEGSVAIARDFGVSEAFIGLTIVAVGTSLPELATSLVAAFRRQTAIAIGNVVGSNIFNILGILGVTAIVRPIPVAPRFLTFDLPVLIVASLVVTGLILRQPQIGRVTGGLLLIGYVVYVIAAR
ncbi:MAG: calcium/sodium antiporter [bacterium]